MTVGEKIQKYRKAFGMSQEELGQKLYVSRQTISLWEKDQTVPTIDNLMRLREVFGVSVDEILDIERKESVSEIEPYETYQFNYTKTELKEIDRLQRRSIYKRQIFLALISIFLIIFLIGSSAPNLTIGFAYGMIFTGSIFYIKEIHAYNKAWKKSLERMRELTYEYKIFEDKIGVNIYRKNEKIRESNCYYTDIEQIQQCGKWLLFQFGGQLFIVRKSDLKESSAFFSYMYKNPSKVIESTFPNISIILFAASLLSILGALTLVGAVSCVNNLFVENMWLFFLLTPIPIASIVWGYVLKSKGCKYKKNIVVGIIMTALLCIYGSFTFIFANEYDHSDEPIIKVEQMIGIDIPEHRYINTQDWTKGTQSDSRECISSTSDVYFNNSVAEEFEKQLAIDEKWLSLIPNDLISITSTFSNYYSYDYMLIYNTDTSEYNTLPHESGAFHFINILYRSNENQMKIVEYSIDYVK